MRARLASGERSSKYAPGQFVSTAYANRYPHKVSLERDREPDYIPIGPEPEEEFFYEWEITVEYP